MGHDNRPPFLRVFRADGSWIHPGIADSPPLGREFRQSGVECLGEIHGVFGRWMEAVMPGRNNDCLPSNAMTSTVPLAGSTTGLTWMTLAEVLSPWPVESVSET